MAIRIPKRDTISGKIKEYNELGYSEEKYERFYSDATRILTEKWDEYAKNSNLSENYKNILKYAYTSYLKKLKKMDFIDPENITYIFEVLDKNITSFSSRNSGGNIYAVWGSTDGQIAINTEKCKTMSQEEITRIIFHEMTHALINRKISGENPAFENTENVNHNTMHFKAKIGTKIGYVKIKNKREEANCIDAFLKELLAEEMAQQLWYEDDNRPARTEQPAGIIGFQPDRVIYSNYGPGYNRCYQQLGEEFAKNLTNINTPENNTHEKRLKALLKLCLNPNVDVLDTIYNGYCNPDEAHKAKLFSALGNVTSRAGGASSGGRALIDTSLIYADGELFRILEEDRERFCGRVTPQDILETSRHAIRINPGQVSKGVRTARGIKMRNRTDKDEHTRN